MAELRALDEFRELCEEAAQRHGVVPDVHPADFIFRFLIDNPVFPAKNDAVAYYFNDGARSAQHLQRLVCDVCEVGDRPIDLLEFASGFGCVTRHLPRAVPSWKVVSCDIHSAAIEFLSQRLGATAVLSTTAPEDLRPGGEFDVVFALSFFSHMPRQTFGRWMRALASVLRPGGHLIFTTHGAVSHAKHLRQMKLEEDGFSFLPASEQHDLNTADYGTTLSHTQFVLPHILALEEFSLRFFQEGFWWDHQDVYIVRRVRFDS
jgi:SAM-dependent methyltransferase